jgi:SAM-dependent methyltransferase
MLEEARDFIEIAQRWDIPLRLLVPRSQGATRVASRMTLNRKGQMTAAVRGTEGYAENARDFLARDQSLVFTDVHAPVLHLLPTAPCDVLDVGAGGGRDAAHFAGMGHRVVAVEPTEALRAHAVGRNGAPHIEWLNDSLPDLADTRALGRAFDLVMLTAVWMHLDEAERRRAMPNLAALMRGGGAMIMSLRHGPVPPGRRMFEVTGAETIDLARSQGLDCLLNTRTESVQEHNRLAGVTWTRLAFRKG